MQLWPQKLHCQYAVRELKGSWNKFTIFILCLWIGVAAISGVNALARMLTDSIDAQSQTLLGGDLKFDLLQREANEEELQAIKALGDVSVSATLRTNVRKQDGTPLFVELRAVDEAYPLYGAFKTLQSNSLPIIMQQGGALAAPEVLSRLEIEPGSALGLGQLTTQLIDQIEREPDQLSGGLGLGPRVLISLTTLEKTNLAQFGSLVNWQYLVRVPQQVSNEDLNQIVNDFKAQFPQSGWTVKTRARAAPQLDNSVGLFSQFLTLIGLASLIVGGVGVANSAHTFLLSRQGVIATLKCVGASGSFVFWTYLIQMMAVAAIGTVAGVLTGAFLPFFAVGYVSSFAGFDVTAALYPDVMLFAALFGFLTALSFCVVPLGQAQQTPVTMLFRSITATNLMPARWWAYGLAALCLLALLGLALLSAPDLFLALVFMGSCLLAFILLRVIAVFLMFLAKLAPRRLPFTQGGSTQWRLAMGNISRKGALTPVIMLSLGLGLTLLVTMSLLDVNLRTQLRGAIPETAPSFFVLDIEPREAEAFDAFVLAQHPKAHIDRIANLRGRITKIKGVDADKAKIDPEFDWVLRGDRGVAASDIPPETADSIEGEWWPQGYEGPTLVSMKKDIAEGLGMRIGDMIEVSVLGLPIEAKLANIRTFEWQSLNINFVMIFSQNALRGAPAKYLATLTFNDDLSKDDELFILKQVSNRFPTATAIWVKGVLEQINGVLNNLALAIRLASSVALFSAALVLGGALAASQRQRVYDAVILKMLGARRGEVIGAFAIEYGLIGLSAGLLALLAGSLIAWAILTQIFDLDFFMATGPVLMAISGAALVTLGLGMVGTWRALLRKPATILREL